MLFRGRQAVLKLIKNTKIGENNPIFSIPNISNIINVIAAIMANSFIVFILP